MPPDDQLPDIYQLDYTAIATQQKDMPEWLEHHDEDSQYIIINGLLYSTKLPYKYAPVHPRLVLPPQDAIATAHQHVRHMSVMKTMHKLQEGFTWPHMKCDVANYISRYPTCITQSKEVPRAPMGKMPLATAPMQIVAADLMGPLVTSFDNN